MSCKRFKKDATPDDLTGVDDSVKLESEAGLAAADTSERVWSTSDFTIFNELQKPVVVILPGFYQSQPR